MVASATIEYPMYQEKNGWAEQEPLDWWNAAAGTIRTVIEKSGVDSRDIKALGISGQMHGLVMLDKDGAVLRRSIIWCDQRTAAECEEITEKVGKERLIQITANPALTGFTASKILWVRNHQPEIYQKCAHILLPKDYVRYMLTGDFATEVSDASACSCWTCPTGAGARRFWRSWTSTRPCCPRSTRARRSPGWSPRRRQPAPGWRGHPGGGRRRGQRRGRRGHRCGPGRPGLYHHRHLRGGVRPHR